MTSAAFMSHQEQPWPANPGTLAYMITHDAHHRGQACLLAHHLGHPLPSKAIAAMWSWEKLAKSASF